MLAFLSKRLCKKSQASFVFQSRGSNGLQSRWSHVAISDAHCRVCYLIIWFIFCLSLETGRLLTASTQPEMYHHRESDWCTQKRDWSSRACQRTETQKIQTKTLRKYLSDGVNNPLSYHHGITSPYMWYRGERIPSKELTGAIGTHSYIAFYLRSETSRCTLKRCPFSRSHAIALCPFATSAG